MVVRAAGFHDDQGHLAVGESAFELGAGEAMRFNDAPGVIGHGELENRLCPIDGNRCSIHVGLLANAEDLMIPTPMKTRAPMWRKPTGESISSRHPTTFGVG